MEQLKLLFEEDSNKDQLIKEQMKRIDNAIEYIEHHYATTERTGMMFHECENVIDILRGDK